MDTVTLGTIAILAFSVVVFILFGRFTLKLIKQHYDVNMLLYVLEEEEKKKKQ